MSNIVQSPAIAKDGRQSRSRTGQLLRSMKLLEEATTPVNTKMMSHLKQDTSLPVLEKSLVRHYEDIDESTCRVPLYDESILNRTDTEKTFYLTRLDASTEYSALFGNVTFSVADNPGLAVTSGLFSDFKESYIRHDSSSQVFDLVGSYVEICSDYIALLEKILSQSTSEEIKNPVQQVKVLLVHEKHTWALINALYRDRLCSEGDEPLMEFQSSVKYLSEKFAVDDYFLKNNDVRQAQIVIDWLEQNASEELSAVAEKFKHYSCKASWQNTLYQLKKDLDSGRKTNKSYVEELDCDATTRTRKQLHELDREDEARFLRYVFTCIRAGRIDEAKELCILHGQPWRAATIEGWRLFHDSNLINANEDGGSIPTEGNPTRTLWKYAAWHCSNNTEYDIKERAIYGALCGNLSSMLEVSLSWEDSVWAYYKTMVDMAIERFLQFTPNIDRPWQNLEAPSLPDEYHLQQCDLSNPCEIFDKISNSPDKAISENSTAPHHIIQRCIILNDMDALLTQIVSWIDSGSIGDQQTRFYAHLVLLLQALGASLDPDKLHAVLSAYVRFLVADERTGHLVAVYTATLSPEKQLSSYSSFLESVTDSEMRKKYVKLAEEAGLDVRSITKNVVERIRSSGDPDSFPSSTVTPFSNDPLPDTPLTPSDIRKIGSIEWLVFDPSQRAEALIQSNAVIRHFLASCKHKAARKTLEMIPSDSIAVIHREWHALVGKDSPLPAEIENAEREHLCMQAFLLVQTAFSDWFKHYHKKPRPYEPANHSAAFSNMSISDLVAEEQRQKLHNDGMERWQQTLQRLCDDVSNKIYNVLLFPDGGWLRDARKIEMSDENECRHRQLDLLRRLYIPSLCNLLLNVILNTGGRNEQCSKLADVIADEEQKLYELFNEQDGRRLLLRIQDMMIECL